MPISDSWIKHAGKKSVGGMRPYPLLWEPVASGGGKQIASVDGHASGQRVATCECHSWHQVDMANRQVAARARGDASRPTAKKRNTNAAFEEVKFAFLKGGQL